MRGRIYPVPNCRRFLALFRLRNIAGSGIDAGRRGDSPEEELHGTKFKRAPGIHAQIVVDTPFSFIIEGKTLPAGNYTIAENIDQHTGTILDNKSKESGVSICLTRLSRPSANQAEAVFGVVGTNIISPGYICRISTDSSSGALPETTLTTL
jgi:hypothetical protein